MLKEIWLNRGNHVSSPDALPRPVGLGIDLARFRLEHICRATSPAQLVPKTAGNSRPTRKTCIIYSRPHGDSRLKEFKAIGPIDAPTYSVHAVIDDFENYPKFMPYTLECRLLKREGDSMIGYQRLSPKICEDRDYTLRVWKKSWPGPKGLTYLSQWEAANELGPRGTERRCPS